MELTNNQIQDIIEDDENEDMMYFDSEDDDDDFEYFDCTCGAWKWSIKEQKYIHTSDCICGSSEPFN